MMRRRRWFKACLETSRKRSALQANLKDCFHNVLRLIINGAGGLVSVFGKSGKKMARGQDHGLTLVATEEIRVVFGLVFQRLKILGDVDNHSFGTFQYYMDINIFVVIFKKSFLGNFCGQRDFKNVDITAIQLNLFFT